MLPDVLPNRGGAPKSGGCSQNVLPEVLPKRAPKSWGSCSQIVGVPQMCSQMCSQNVLSKVLPKRAPRSAPKSAPRSAPKMCSQKCSQKCSQNVLPKALHIRFRIDMAIHSKKVSKSRITLECMVISMRKRVCNAFGSTFWKHVWSVAAVSALRRCPGLLAATASGSEGRRCLRVCW